MGFGGFAGAGSTLAFCGIEAWFGGAAQRVFEFAFEGGDLVTEAGALDLQGIT